VSVDIAFLTKDSLHAWLRSRGGENLWAENVVAMQGTATSNERTG